LNGGLHAFRVTTPAQRARTMTVSRGVKDTPQSQRGRSRIGRTPITLAASNYSGRRQRTVPIDLRRKSRGKPV
jgi:hypothetical protein